MNFTLVMSRPKRVIPYQHHHKVVGAFHKWLGENVLHDQTSLYSISWLMGGRAKKTGLKFMKNPILHVSTPIPMIIHELAAGIVYDPSFIYDMEVIDSSAVETIPDFENEVSGTFELSTPLFVKDYETSKFGLYISKNVDIINSQINSLMRRKLYIAGLSELPLQLSVIADDTVKEKTFQYIKDGKMLYHSANCNVKVNFSGHSTAVKFAAEVGIGNSTGIGYGYVKHVWFKGD